MDQIRETIESARDYRGALLADALRRVWAQLTHAAQHFNGADERNVLPRAASNSVSPGHR